MAPRIGGDAIRLAIDGRGEDLYVGTAELPSVVLGFLAGLLSALGLTYDQRNSLLVGVAMGSTTTTPPNEVGRRPGRRGARRAL